jgi:hypothetical protein
MAALSHGNFDFLPKTLKPESVSAPEGHITGRLDQVFV